MNRRGFFATFGAALVGHKIPKVQKPPSPKTMLDVLRLYKSPLTFPSFTVIYSKECLGGPAKPGGSYKYKVLNHMTEIG